MFAKRAAQHGMAIIYSQLIASLEYVDKVDFEKNQTTK